MAGCKCRYCQASLLTQNACKATIKNKTAYFCNEEHHSSYLKKIEEEEKEKEIAKEAKKALTVRKREEKKLQERAKIEKYKKDKDRVYYAICEILNKKEIINTILWKEWAIWNKVASNEVIGQYIEENKEFLIKTISRLDDSEFLRIKYLSAIIKNNIGDYKPNIKETQKPKVAVDETFYAPTTGGGNKRRSLVDLEDDF